jgi:hypothetical protein
MPFGRDECLPQKEGFLIAREGIDLAPKIRAVLRRKIKDGDEFAWPAPGKTLNDIEQNVN